MGAIHVESRAIHFMDNKVKYLMSTDPQMQWGTVKMKDENDAASERSMTAMEVILFRQMWDLLEQKNKGWK